MVIDKDNIGKILVLAAVLALGLFSFQYPYVMSTPLGGDAQTHIQIARYPFEGPANHHLVSSSDALKKSRYPLSSSLFAGTRILPFSWETRFTLWMATGHLVTGLLVGLLAYRIGGYFTASLAMFFFAASTMEVLPFFRAATMAQLWSMPFLVAFLERMIKGSYGWAALLLAGIYFTHPATFATAATATALVLPAMLLWRYLPNYSYRRYLVAVSVPVTAGIVLSLIMLYSNSIPYASFSYREPWPTLREIMASSFGPVLLLAPLGAFVFTYSKRIRPEGRLFLLAFGAISLLLTVNGVLGGDVPGKRLIPYMIMIASIWGALGFYELLKFSFRDIRIRYLAIAVIPAIVLIGGWRTAGGLYHAFEDGCNVPYPCPAMTPAEREAYYWIKSETDKEAVMVVMEGRGRATEWIPVIADRGLFAERFNGRSARKMLMESCENVLNEVFLQPVTHAVFYERRDIISDTYIDNPHVFPVIYTNEEVTVMSFPNKDSLDSPDKIADLCQN